MTRGQSSPSVQSPEEVAAELAERIFETGLGAFELVTITLGDRLGLYPALADRGPTTVSLVAATVGTDPRYAREWCEQQAVAGLLDVDDAAGDIEERRFDLLPGSEAVFLDPQSPAYVMPLGGFLEAVCRVLPALEVAFRSGAGALRRLRGATCASSLQSPRLLRPARPGMASPGSRSPREAARRRHRRRDRLWRGLGRDRARRRLPRPVRRRLRRGPSVDRGAVRNAETAGVADRIRFAVADAADPGMADHYDAVFAFE